MSANNKIKTRCPVCNAKYRVPVSVAGHRAHCGKCDTTFRVAKLDPPKPESSYIPTEDDILKWLNEDRDEYDMPVRPRIIDDVPAEPAAVDSENQEEGSEDIHNKAIPSALSDRFQDSEADVHTKVMTFRKTG
ncbi:MAG: hypothetical protein JSV03_07560 [Planctomycetota bacterium]|nr:MAG: hypothetical protein JSV03_07560 [Planctomycetota bacterium]